MLIKNPDLNYCLTKAIAITESYLLTHIAADDPQRSVDNLIDTCNSYLNSNITVYELEIAKDEGPVWGAYIAGDDFVHICVVQGLNYCWKRFVICKEVFHAILDAEEYRNMSISEHVDEVTVAFPDHESSPSAPVVAEALAEIAAMEFLIPYKQRLLEMETCNGTINHLNIAEKYKVPRVLVEKYFSENFMESLKPIS